MGDRFFPNNNIRNLKMNDFVIDTLDLISNKKCSIVLFYDDTSSSKYLTALLEQCLDDVSNNLFGICNVKEEVKISTLLKQPLPIIMMYCNGKMLCPYDKTISTCGITNFLLTQNSTI